MTITPVRFFRPRLVIKNISNKDVAILDRINSGPGQILDVFEVSEAGSVPEDLILRNLFIPDGDLFVEVIKKQTLEILELDLPSFHYAQIDPLNIIATGPYFTGAIPVANAEGTFDWVAPQHPLIISGGNLSIPPASSTQDGYLSKEDFALFSSAAVSNRGLIIWEYQDFTAPLSTSLQLDTFQNGTGLSFNGSWIINNTASIVLLSDTEKPPTTVLSFPGRLLSSNRVSVSSQIGTTVILNQAPDPSLSCRVFYQVNLPAGTPLPAGYEEDPNFVNEKEQVRQDDNFVNITGDEAISGAKTFEDLRAQSFKFTTGATNGYVFTSNSAGFASWQPSGSGIVIASGAPPSPFPGQQWVNVDGYESYTYDATRGKWLSARTIQMNASRNNSRVSNLYLRNEDGSPTNLAPLIAPYDLTLIAMSASCSDPATWIAEVRKNNGTSAITTLTMTTDVAVVTQTKNIDFMNGDAITIFMNGTNISFPRVTLIFARRSG